MTTLRTDWLTEQAGSDAAKKTQDEHATLLKENEQLKAEAARSKRRAVVDAAITEAELPEAMVSDRFRDDCLSADDEGLAKLIAEQKTVYTKLTEEWEEKKPSSKGKSTGGGDTSKLRDGKTFASTITE